MNLSAPNFNSTWLNMIIFLLCFFLIRFMTKAFSEFRIQLKRKVRTNRILNCGTNGLFARQNKIIQWLFSTSGLALKGST